MCFNPFRLIILLFLFTNQIACAKRNKLLQAKGLKQPVEILRDRWGIAHIYAQNEHDLFFAQGYTAASDRLFQLEIWRRQATGTVADLLGPQELKRDTGSRLFRFRGNLDEELKHYHPAVRRLFRRLSMVSMLTSAKSGRHRTGCHLNLNC